MLSKTTHVARGYTRRGAEQAAASFIEVRSEKGEEWEVVEEVKYYPARIPGWKSYHVQLERVDYED